MTSWDTTKSYLFTYFLEGKPDFWVFDGRQFCRFILIGGKFRLIRIQPNLPAQAAGCFAEVTPEERRSLESEAARHGIHLRFARSTAECELHALLDRHEQYVFDKIPPAGYFVFVEEEEE